MLADKNRTCILIMLPQKGVRNVTYALWYSNIFLHISHFTDSYTFVKYLFTFQVIFRRRYKMVYQPQEFVRENIIRLTFYLLLAPDSPKLFVTSTNYMFTELFVTTLCKIRKPYYKPFVCFTKQWLAIQSDLCRSVGIESYVLIFLSLDEYVLISCRHILQHVFEKYL